MIVLISLILVAFLFLYLVKGRSGHEGLAALRGWAYAHRGLHSVGIPENSMAAFRAAKDGGYGVELDVHLMQDGSLAVIHDSSLKRTAGSDVMIEDLTAEQLQAYTLEGTEEKIPLLSQILELFQGEVPLIVELKPANGNQGALSKAVCDLMESYQGAYCVESFDPRCIAWLRKNRNKVIRGQLTEDFFHSNSPLPWCLKFALKHQLLNVVARPDFVAYRYKDRKTVSNFICRKIWGMQGVSWTIRTPEEYAIAVREGWIPIFENFTPDSQHRK